MTLSCKKESHVENEFVKMVEANPNWHTEKFEFKGRRGAPDRIVFIHPGKVVFIEFKRSKSYKASPHQKFFADKMKKLGFGWFLASSAVDAYLYCKEVSENDD